MKHITYTLIITIVFIGCTQERSSDQQAQTNQEPTAKQTNSKENNDTDHTPIAEQAVQSAQKITPPKAFVKQVTPQELKDEPTEENSHENIIAEEQDTTSPPPKSQEELDDEAEADNTTSVAEEELDTDTVMGKSDIEISDESESMLENIAEEHGIAPKKPLNEIEDEESLTNS